MSLRTTFYTHVLEPPANRPGVGGGVPSRNTLPASCVHPVAANQKSDKIAYFKFGTRRRTRLMIPRPLTGTISINCALVRFEVLRRKWLLPPFVRTSSPDAVRRKRFDVALWVLSLNLPTRGFLGTAAYSFRTN